MPRLLLHPLQGALLRYFSSEGWRQEAHALWPPAFRAAVRALLLCAHRQHQAAMRQAGHGGGVCGDGGGAAGLWTLPPALIHDIVGLAAGRRTDWLPPAEPYDPEQRPLNGAFPPGQARLI